jgi:hypothetical protein
MLWLHFEPVERRGHGDTRGWKRGERWGDCCGEREERRKED